MLKELLRQRFNERYARSPDEANDMSDMCVEVVMEWFATVVFNNQVELAVKDSGNKIGEILKPNATD